MHRIVDICKSSEYIVAGQCHLTGQELATSRKQYRRLQTNNDHPSSYNDLLSKSDRCTMLISRQRELCIEIFKTVNKLNPLCMQKIFELRTSCYFLPSRNDLAHIRQHQTTFGSNSLISIGPQIWYHLPNELKSAEI